jgi:hypothetical protein
MAARPSNAMNLVSTTSGLVNWDGTSTMSTTALTQYYTLVGAGANTVTNIAPGTSGWVLTSTGASGNPAYTALPYTKMPWTDETTTFSPLAQNGYFVTGTATATLPASPSQGDTISFFVDGGVALTITANTSQVIQVGSQTSASAGTCVNAATTTGCSITLVYRSSDTKWACISVVGTWTIT